MSNVVPSFEEIAPAALTAMAPEEFDALPFGAVGLDRSGVVVRYNITEARMAGLDAQAVIGAAFFDSVAQCMNNFMVAQRFEDETELDEIIPYVLTLKMRPTKVRLRLLGMPTAPLNFILIER